MRVVSAIVHDSPLSVFANCCCARAMSAITFHHQLRLTTFPGRGALPTRTKHTSGSSSLFREEKSLGQKNTFTEQRDATRASTWVRDFLFGIGHVIRSCASMMLCSCGGEATCNVYGPLENNSKAWTDRSNKHLSLKKLLVHSQKDSFVSDRSELV